MKWMFAGDLHGSARYTKQLMDAFDREMADRLLLLGDLLYHGPRNDLPEEYNPKAVIALLNDKKDRLFSVRGNCDSEVDQMVLEFPIVSDFILLPLGEHLLCATHGHHAPPPLCPGDLLLCGHTHIPLCEKRDTLFYLNPGSVGIPKERSPHSYMTLEDGVFRWKELSTGKIYQSVPLC